MTNNIYYKTAAKNLYYDDDTVFTDYTAGNTTASYSTKTYKVANAIYDKIKAMDQFKIPEEFFTASPGKYEPKYFDEYKESVGKLAGEFKDLSNMISKKIQKNIKGPSMEFKKEESKEYEGWVVD